MKICKLFNLHFMIYYAVFTLHVTFCVGILSVFISVELEFNITIPHKSEYPQQFFEL